MNKTALGVIALSLAAAKEQMRRGDAPNRGLLSLTFGHVLSSQRREAVFRDVQERERLALANHLKVCLDQKIKTLQVERGEALARQRDTFSADRAALIERQNAEREKIRDAWRQIYSRRGSGIASGQEKPAMKNEFDKRAQGLPLEPKITTERRFVSSPAPSPSPSGAPPVQARTVQNVPKKAEPAPKVARTPALAKEWGKVALPKPAPAKDWTKAEESPKPVSAKDWNAKPDQPREPKPLPTKGKDRDWER